jgi:hypothetical protein
MYITTYDKLNMLFEDALKDGYATNMDGEDYEARLSYGIKIVRNKDMSVSLFNTFKGGDYYQELNDDEYGIFLEKGWKHGLYKLCIKRYREKIDTINLKLRDEKNTRNNSRYIDFLKSTLKDTFDKYNTITKKLNHESTENNKIQRKRLR